MKGHFMSQLQDLIDAFEKETKDIIARNKRTIIDNVPEAALYEQLGEEAAELAHACFKKSRVIRGENPTPVSSEEASINVCEELTDVHVASFVLGLSKDPRLFFEKIARWAERLS